MLLILSALVGLIAFLAYKYLTLKEDFAERIQQQSLTQFQNWRAQEIEIVRREQSELANREAQVQLEEWKKKYEKLIREDAIKKSEAVTIGKWTPSSRISNSDNIKPSESDESDEGKSLIQPGTQLTPDKNAKTSDAYRSNGVVAIRTCPHNIPITKKCGICDPEGFRRLYGDP